MVERADHDWVIEQMVRELVRRRESLPQPILTLANEGDSRARAFSVVCARHREEIHVLEAQSLSFRNDVDLHRWPEHRIPLEDGIGHPLDPVIAQRRRHSRRVRSAFRRFMRIAAICAGAGGGFIAATMAVRSSSTENSS